MNKQKIKKKSYKKIIRAEKLKFVRKHPHVMLTQVWSDYDPGHRVEPQ